MDVQMQFDSTFLNELDDLQTIITRDNENWCWEREESISMNPAISTNYEYHGSILSPISSSACFSPESQNSPIYPVTVQRLSSVDSDDHLCQFFVNADNDERKIKRREQNRKAAKTCREKKKKLADQSIQEYQQASCENTRLQYLLNQARKERENLDQQIVRVKCYCPLISRVAHNSNPVNGFKHGPYTN